jgi:hypothetical protein
MATNETTASRPLVWTTLIGLLLLAACGGGSNAYAFRQAVSQRAAFDLDCAASQTTVRSIGGNGYGANGCGKKAAYTCICMWSEWGTCTQPACALDNVAPAP